MRLVMAMAAQMGYGVPQHVVARQGPLWVPGQGYTADNHDTWDVSHKKSPGMEDQEDGDGELSAVEYDGYDE